MTSFKTYLAFLFVIIKTCSIHGQDIMKSSLTFVIDDTNSMFEEIDQVKESANSIFDTVVTSKDSQIQNFILVTFNDPDYHLLTITNDRDEFKRTLASIYVHGGDDCPEYAMSGIKTALENSLPLSLLYVFTDASAKDHAMFEEVKSISQKKQIQVTFLLTGDCEVRSARSYQVYHELARATSGEVFNMMKSDVKEVLDYVKENIKGRGDVLVSKTFPPGYGNRFNYTVDSKTDNLVISVTGRKPKVEVMDPEGKKAKTEPIVNKDEIAIVKVTETKPGLHVAEVGSMSETSAKVTGKTTVNFVHGFSSFEPTSLGDTVTRPGPDGNAYLSIKLHGDGVTLQTAKILDISGNVVQELSLRLINEKTKFYVTESFDPPKTMFRVAVFGYDEETKTPIKRVAATPTERQNPKLVKAENVAPTVTIEGMPKITTDYGAPLQLKCKVHAFPKPDIIWQEKDTGVMIPATVATIEEPYDYISILNIENVKKNCTYECKATNPLGLNSSYIEVKAPFYFVVLKTPKEVISLGYGKKASLVCKVEATPPATISWYKDGILLSDDTNIQLSSDKTTITIEKMDLESQGKYMCEARNNFQRKVFHSVVLVSGLVKPDINKTDDAIHVLRGKDALLTCQIIEGVPRPTIQWFFQRPDDTEFQELSETSEVLHLNQVALDAVGTYKCTATNVMGTEQYAIELVVEYPPAITDDNVRIIRAKDGDVVIIPCEVDGVPNPTVIWLKGETRLNSTKDIHITTNNGLKFQEIVVADTGYYTCKAENGVGSSTKTIYVDVFVPVNIEIPKESSIETLVGKNLILACRADGYPRPAVKWIYNDFDGKRPPKSLRSHLGTTSLSLRRIQLRDQGYYTCVASNVGGSSNITYIVTVNAPPVIENSYADRTFSGVKGDLALRIQCKASGSPKPEIIWKKDDLNIASGSEWYDIEDGTLIIKNIDEKSQGSYLCLAQNKIGNDTMVYDVIVNDYPIPGRHVSRKFIENGKSVDMKCGIPHTLIDSLRWYKDRKLIAEGELTLRNVERRDEGLYSCRVSNNSKSLSEHFGVEVGYKPVFVSEEPDYVEFIQGDYVPLVCKARGQPKPQVSWKLNDKEIGVTEMTYHLEMMLNNRGKYTCTVSNELGSIHRSFNVVAKDCILDTRKDFVSDNQPIMLSPSLTWPLFNVVNNYMVIRHADPFYLHCPKGFSKFPSPYVRVFCDGETKVKINGNVYEYSEIKCKDETELTMRSDGRNCLPGNTENVQVGYKVLDRFLKVYEVCLDKHNNVPLFTRHQLSPAQYNASENERVWSLPSLLPLDFNVLYDCKTQANDISSTLGKSFHLNDDCCFDKRQLVSPKDLRPGIPTAATYTYLNVVPHWSTCNSKNWADVEKRVRNLAKTVDHDLTVITGTAKQLQMGRHLYRKDIELQDKRGRKQPVAQYLWKVVQDPASSRSLAIIQVNVPDLTAVNAPAHVRCEDICHEIRWMKSTNWHNVADGYTYCCSILSFENAFGYRRRFSPDKTGILNDVSVAREYYYSI